MSAIQPGTIVDGRFQLRDEIGRGGMGIVYRAYQISIEREVAVKVLRPDCSADLNKLQRFRREAHLISVLEHPHIVQVYAIGMMQAGQPYIAMEFLPGEQLSERISRTGPLSWQEALPIFVQVCDALQYAHDKQIIHRDLKPSNIALLRDDGKTVAKLVDFGIAKIMEQDASTKLTQTSVVVGSILYTSPSQFEGKEADVRSDIYSLGCTFYEALTGKPPCNGETVFETISAHLNQRPKSINEAYSAANVPEDLEYVISSMLRKDELHRQRSAAQVQAQLNDIMRGVRIERDNHVSSLQPQAEKWRRRSRTWMAIASVIVLSVILGCILSSRKSVAAGAVPTASYLTYTDDPDESKLVDRIVHISDKSSFGYAENLHQLGNVYARAGRALEAQILHERVAKLHVGARKLEIKNSNALGRDYSYTGRWNEAEECLLLSIDKSDLHDDSTFIQREYLVGLYLKSGQFEKADAALNIILPAIDAGFRSELEAEHVLQEAVQVSIALGRNAEAQARLKRLRQSHGQVPDTELAEAHALVKADPKGASVRLMKLVHNLNVNTGSLVPEDKLGYYMVLTKLVVDCHSKLSGASSDELGAALTSMQARSRQLFKDMNDRSRCKLPV